MSLSRVFCRLPRVPSRLLAALLLAVSTAPSFAAPTYFQLSVDDFGSLSIDGVSVATYDAFPWGVASGSVDLAAGWYPISLDYANRWGTSALYFYQRDDLASPWELVPADRLRSRDASGSLVDGLRADYYTSTGAFLGTLFGEGPVAHGWPQLYAGQGGAIGNPIVDQYWIANWRAFEARLSGEIYIDGAAIPEPAPLALFSLGLGMLAVGRRFGQPTAE
jgi:hypothetical protein